VKIKDIISEGFWAGVKRGLTPQVFKNMPDMPARGTRFGTDADYCAQAAAKFGLAPDECGSQQPGAAPAAPQPSRRIPQQIEIGGTTLTRAAGGDWYDMTTNTLITDPSIIARADKRWQIQQQILQMAPGYQPMSPFPGFNRRSPGSKRGAKP
jgi:hypothetical protein